MTISRTELLQQLLDRDTPLSAGLRALVALAYERGDVATAAWARQELDGYPAAGPLPDYRRITAPIYGMDLENGAPIYQQLQVADLPAGHRDEIAAADAALGLPHGVTTLEKTLQPRPYSRGPDPVLHRDLPHADDLIRLLHDAGLHFVNVHWEISTDTVTAVLAAIRETAETKTRALPALPEPPRSYDERTQTWWARYSGVISTISVVVAIVAVIVAIWVGVRAGPSGPAVHTPSPSSASTAITPSPRTKPTSAPRPSIAPPSHPPSR